MALLISKCTIELYKNHIYIQLKLSVLCVGMLLLIPPLICFDVQIKESAYILKHRLFCTITSRMFL